LTLSSAIRKNAACNLRILHRPEERTLPPTSTVRPPSATRPRLDDVDRAIIEALQVEGRRPYKRIADEIGVSEGSVRYRVARLEESGILQVVGIADPLRIGFNTMALVGIRVRPGSMEDVCRELAKLPQASYVAMVTGSFDVFVEAVCRDPEDFRTFLTRDLHGIDGVLGAESFIILELHKLAYGWGVASADPAPRLLGGGRPKQVREPSRTAARARTRRS
jgi:Lrp/AsnC family transcriptional regulator for asnA, asnC and gidA